MFTNQIYLSFLNHINRRPSNFQTASLFLCINHPTIVSPAFINRVLSFTQAMPAPTGYQLIYRLYKRIRRKQHSKSRSIIVQPAGHSFHHKCSHSRSQTHRKQNVHGQISKNRTASPQARRNR